jgi:hypothetical protein
MRWALNFRLVQEAGGVMINRDNQASAGASLREHAATIAVRARRWRR